GAAVHFEVREGGALLETNGVPASTVTAVTDNRGFASARMRAPERGDGLSGGITLFPGDQNYSNIFISMVDVSVDTRSGSLRPGEPFVGYMKAGDPVRISIEPKTATILSPTNGQARLLVHAYDAFDNDVSNVQIQLNVGDT